MLTKLKNYIAKKGFNISWTYKFKAPKKTWKQKNTRKG